MAMTDMAFDLSTRPLAGTTFRDDLVQLARNWRARQQQRSLMRQLARRDPRLLADMGLDPCDVRSAVENTWDEFRPERMLRSAPWI